MTNATSENPDSAKSESLCENSSEDSSFPSTAHGNESRSAGKFGKYLVRFLIEGELYRVIGWVLGEGFGFRFGYGDGEIFIQPCEILVGRCFEGGFGELAHSDYFNF